MFSIGRSFLRDILISGDIFFLIPVFTNEKAQRASDNADFALMTHGDSSRSSGFKELADKRFMF